MGGLMWSHVRRACARGRRTSGRLGLAAALTAAAVTVGVFPGSPVGAVPTLPSGFSLVTINTGFAAFDLVNFSFLPNGDMLAIGKCGAIRRVTESGTSVPVATLPVQCTGDRGLLGFDLAPDFATSRKVYALYDYNRNDGLIWARLSSWTLDSATAPTAITGETIILDDLPSWSSTGAICDDSHTVGTVVAAADGTIYVGNGDASGYCNVDSSALAAQDLTSPRGKIMRINPDGTGVASNPFYQSGSPTSWQSRVYAYGVRNPYRFGLRPGTNTLYIGDVGWTTYEEIDVATGAGENFGWPCWEGPLTFRNPYSSLAACQTAYANVTSTPPLHSWIHTSDNAAVGGVFYTGTTYPADYQGAFFFGDYGNGRMWTVRTNAQNQLVRGAEPDGFGADIGGPVAFRTGPSGDVYYADIISSTIRRIRYIPGNRPPTAAITTDRTSGPLPLTVQFSAATSFDPDNDPLTYAWSFGDGTTATGATVAKTYPTAGAFTATLTVTDPLGASSTATRPITAGQNAPVLTTTITPNTPTFAVGDQVRVDVSAVDSEDGVLPDAAITYQSILRHCPSPGSCHAHPGPIAGEQRIPGGWAAAIPDHGGDFYLELDITATDSQGAIDTRVIRFDSRYRNLTVTSTPAGAPIVVNASDTTTGSTFRVVENSLNSITAPDRYADKAFVRWADGNDPRSRTVLMSTADVSVNAIYTTVPRPVIGATPAVGVSPLTVSFTSAGSTDPDGDALTYSWNFGDGSPAASGATASHTYTANGTFTATLTATDSNGATATATTPILIGNEPTGLVAAYAFDEGAGTTTADATSFRNTGTAANTTWTAAGRFGAALSFNGTSSIVRVPDANQLDLTNALTVAAWVRPATTSGWRTVLLKQIPGNLAYSLYSSSTAARPSGWIRVGNNEVDATATGALSTTAWSHLAMTYDGATMRLYVNGVLLATRAIAGSVPTSTSGLGIGGNDVWSEFYSGLIDEVRIYNRPLSAAEIGVVMNAPITNTTPDTSPPTAPAGLTATGGVSSVGLSWTASTDNIGVTGYDVHRATTAGFTPSAANRIATVTTTSYADTALAAGSYRYVVIARDAAANSSPPSNEASGVVTGDVTAPTVSITAPANNATVTGTVTVTATATDAVGVAGVQFRLDGAVLGAEDTTSPYSVSWNTATATPGTHTLTAVARDAAGNTTTSTTINVTITGDVTAPTVSITAPANNATVTGTISVSATATDASGIAGVQFRLDGAALGAEDTTSPYSVSWNTTTATVGSHVLTAVARDNAGLTTTSTDVNVTVTGDTTAPTAPSNLVAAGGVSSVGLTWTASTDNTGVTGYDIHRATTAGFTPSAANRIATVTTTSYTDGALVPGAYRYVVIARDAAGNSSLPSNEATGTVTGDITPPTVSITAPANNATVTGTVTVSATASDASGVAGVQFRLDGVALGAEDTASPYNVSWNTATATPGAHVLTAVARDAAGLTTTSANVNVTVQAAATGGLVAAYNFNEGIGTVLLDRSGNGNDGTLINGPTWSAAGQYGGALSFDGSNDRVQVPDSNSLDLTTGMTISAWVRPTTLAGWRTAVMKERAGGFAYALYASKSSPQRPNAWIFNGAERSVTSNTAASTTAWRHVAMTYDGATLRVYVGGVQTGSVAVTGSANVSTGALQIGGNTVWSEWFSGLIDDVRIYNRALTAAQITADMNTPVT